jgi:hypothetical protein
MISQLVPYYCIDNTVLLGLVVDNFDNQNVIDTLALRANTITRDIGEPFSIQKHLKFVGYYEEIAKADREQWLLKLQQGLTQDDLEWIVNALTNPTQESVESLLAVPERLQNINYSKDYHHTYYSQEEYNLLKQDHGSHGSWAIWDAKNPKDTSVVDMYRKDLHCRYVLVGLNVSKPASNQPWCNFHGGSHDRKLVKACNTTELRGCYITDLFKDITAKSVQEFNAMLKNGQVDIDLQVAQFRQEMADIKLLPESVMVLMGDAAFTCYNEYFRNYFPNWVVKARHYSDYSTRDEDWVREFHEKLHMNNPKNNI